MLPWWGWVILWTVLVAASTLWLGVLVRDVWGRSKALGREVTRASELVAALEARVDELSEVDPHPSPSPSRRTGSGRSIASRGLAVSRTDAHAAPSGCRLGRA